MAGKKKLAAEFVAWKVMLAISPHEIGDLVQLLVDLGLFPEIRGHKDRRTLLRIILPVPHGLDPQKHFGVFYAELSKFGVSLERRSLISLVCPL